MTISWQHKTGNQIYTEFGWRGLWKCLNLHVLVGAAVQPFCGETWKEVRGNSWQERAEPAVKPQLDECRITVAGHAERVQSDFLYRVQNQRHCRVSGVQSLQENKHPVSCSDQKSVKWGVMLMHTLLVTRLRASSSTPEALERRRFQMGLEPLEVEERLHAKITARSSAFNADSWVKKQQNDNGWIMKGDQKTYCRSHWNDFTQQHKTFMKLFYSSRLQLLFRDVLPRHKRISQQQSHRNAHSSVRCQVGAAALCCSFKIT